MTRTDSDIDVRPATMEDLPAAARLAGELLRMHHAFDRLRFFLPDRVEEGYAWWLGQEIDNPDVVLFVAARGQAIVGYTYARLEERNWNQLLDAHGALHDLWVEPEVRRQGVARRLCEATFRALEEKGASRIVLYTAAKNPGAAAFFAEMGFRETMIEMTRG